MSTDPDMGGAAHIDHVAPLRGLEPDTVYHYRLQGSGPDGMLYRSADLTFRTAPRNSAGRSTKLASESEGAIIREVSSEFGAAWQADNTIDGNPETEWSSRGDGDGAFITIELRGEARLTAVGLWRAQWGVPQRSGSSGS